MITPHEPQTLTPSHRRAIASLLDASVQPRRWVLTTALKLFRDDLRHEAMGLWPEHLAQAAGTTVSDAEEALDDLASTNTVIKRSTGLFVSSYGLVKYLDETSCYIEGELPG